MNPRLQSLALRIIERADREHPADARLREELKQAGGLSRDDGTEISAYVFAYFRWLGHVPAKLSLAEKLIEAINLDLAFQNGNWEPAESAWKKSVPEWINRELEVTLPWLKSLQTKPRLWLRARPGFGREVAAALGDCVVAGKDMLADTLQYLGSHDLFRTDEFHKGRFELQDISSQVTGMVCKPQPGETWWDACAGEGGKALHLCDLMQKKGLLWATDRAEWRLKRFKQRAARAQLFNHRSALWDGAAKLPNKTKFDGILVDAPCSGVGTWQRNPQARWTTTPADVAELSEVQKRLVAHAIPALKPGGKLIYSVCTLTTSETISVAEQITKLFPDLVPLTFFNPLIAGAPETSHLWLWPQETGGNGMFICGWRKPISVKAL